jgi:hypothetical protein
MREGGEDDRDEARPCTSASKAMPVRALARLVVVTTSWPGLWLHLLDLGSCLACSAEKGELVWQGERERRVPGQVVSWW